MYFNHSFMLSAFKIYAFTNYDLDGHFGTYTTYSLCMPERARSKIRTFKQMVDYHNKYQQLKPYKSQR